MTTEENQAPAAPPAVLITHLVQHTEARALMESAAVLLTKAEKFAVIPSDADASVASEFRARLNQTIKDLDAKRLEATAPHRDLVAQLNKEANEKLEPMKVVLGKVDELLKAYLVAKENKRLADLKAEAEAAAKLEQDRLDAEAKATKANDAAQQAALDAEAAKAALATAATPEAQAEAQQALAQAQTTQQEAINTAAQQAAMAVQLERQVVTFSAPAEPTKTIQGSHGSSTGLRDNWSWKLVDVTKVPEAYLLPPEDRLDRKVLTAKAKSLKRASTDAVPGIEFYNDPIPASRTGR